MLPYVTNSIPLLVPGVTVASRSATALFRLTVRRGNVSWILPERTPHHSSLIWALGPLTVSTYTCH